MVDIVIDILYIVLGVLLGMIAIKVSKKAKKETNKFTVFIFQFAAVLVFFRVALDLVIFIVNLTL